MTAPRIVLMFPGQSSRYPAMIQKVADAHADAASLVRRASDVLGRDLARHYREDNADVFATNRDVQVGVFLANQMHLSVVERAGIRAEWSMGLSLGEYNHLVHIGALSFDAALRLVDERGRLYDEARGGLMVSIHPVEASLVERVIVERGLVGRAAVGLYNSPRQQVVSGERAAVEEVVAAIEEEVYVDATVIEPRIPMHAPPFEAIGTRLGPVLARTAFAAPALPYVPNVLGCILERASVEQIRECLERHTHQSVHWQRSVEAVAARVASPFFLEVGPRAVLSNLFGRGWTPGPRASTDAPQGWRDHLDRVATELRA
jgi:[acyl-carrier-protein] S-malonyltransferase